MENRQQGSMRLTRSHSKNLQQSLSLYPEKKWVCYVYEYCSLESFKNVSESLKVELSSKGIDKEQNEHY